MSAVAERQAGATGRARDRGSATVWSLAQVEGWRLLRSAAFLIGLVFSVALIVMSRELAWGFTSYELLTGIALVPLASGTLIGVYLAGTRPARHGTTELYAATPTRAEVSTWAGLVSLAWPVAVAGAVVAVAALPLAVVRDLEFGDTTLPPRGVPNVLELAQGPAIVLVYGTLGLLLARFVPVLAVAFIAPIMLLWLLGGLSGSTGAGPNGSYDVYVHAVPRLRWLGPWVDYRLFPTEELGFVNGFATGRAGLHALYLVGIASVLATVALLGHGRRRSLGIGAAAGVALAVGAGLLQLP